MTRPANSITAADIAACGGMAPETRRRWVDHHALLGGHSFTQHDAVETAVAAALTRRTNPQRAPLAFRHVRGQLREKAIAGQLALWAIVPSTGRGFSLADSPETAIELAGTVQAPVWIVPLGQAIAQAAQEYAALADALQGRSGGVRRIRSGASDAPSG